MPKEMEIRKSYNKHDHPILEQFIDGEWKQIENYYQTWMESNMHVLHKAGVKFKFPDGTEIAI